MILEQYYLGCLSQASYLIGDEDTGAGAVVDPKRDVDEYLSEAERLGLSEAERLGLRIEHILLTHLHADFLAGHLELAKATGAAIYLGAEADTDFPAKPMRDGERLSLGAVELEFLETPGHTPESVCIVVYPHPQAEPHAVLTGDTLFIGSVGRPDLLVGAGHSAEDLAGQLYDSLHRKLLTLPDTTLVYPGHGAGSACGKGISNETVSTVGAQRAANLMLQSMSKEAFIAEVTGDQPFQPQYFAYDAQQNRKVRPTLDTLLAGLSPLSFERVRELQDQGAVVLDVRPADDFARGHLQESLGIGLEGRFASWAGTVLSAEQKIVLIAPSGSEAEAATRLARIGYDQVVGYLAGGADTLRAHPEAVRSFERVNPEDIEPLVKSPDVQVVDIRTPGEWQAGHIGDTLNMPLESLDQSLARLDAGRPVVLLCQSGYRSIIGASLLHRRGFQNVTDLRGGYGAWALHAGTV